MQTDETEISWIRRVIFYNSNTTKTKTRNEEV